MGSRRPKGSSWLKRILEFKMAQQTRAFAATEMRSVTRELPIELIEKDLVVDGRRPKAKSHESAVQNRIGPGRARSSGLLIYDPKSFRKGSTLSAWPPASISVGHPLTARIVTMRHTSNPIHREPGEAIIP